ncbi:MAG: hybrid sensor histidine kinase/response regulator [Rhodospirillales bacterium]
MLEVHDTGPGIHASQHELIFKEFQRLKENARAAPGLGLGLSIVQRIGRLLQAPIGVKSTPGRGAMFWVRVPTATAPAARTVAPVAPMAGSVAGLVVLCIDDEAVVLSGMRALLEGWGCTVLTSGSTSAAAAVSIGRGTVPDIILADYQLDHDTGLDAIEHVRALAGVRIPGVVITANHSPEVQKQVRSQGLSLLRKPVKAAALRALLTQVQLRRQAAE